LLTLFPTLLWVVGRANFTNVSRYSDYSDRTYRRQFSQFFDFGRFNQAVLEFTNREAREVIAVTDCTFIRKSGWATYGLDWFFNGSASRPERGLELSVIAVVDIAQNTGYTLSAEQTPASPRQQSVSPPEDLEYYKARFQIEFIFRDTKQFLGLCDAQTRDQKRLDFHFNAVLSVLNWVKCAHFQELQSKSVDLELEQPTSPSEPFSMASQKRIALNQYLLELFIEKLGLDPTLIKSHPNYSKLCNHGVIAA
jgi:hypothetical protein